MSGQGTGGSRDRGQGHGRGCGCCHHHASLGSPKQPLPGIPQKRESTQPMGVIRHESSTG